MQWIVFLSMYLLIYGGTHLLLFLKTRALFQWHGLTAVSVALGLGFMVIAPAAAFISERFKLEQLGKALAWTSYVWMGFLFFFLSSWLVISLARGVLLAATRIWPQLSPVLIISPRLALATALGLAVAISLYSLFEAAVLRVETITVETEKIPAGQGPVRIAQISDVHIGLVMPGARLRKMIGKLRDLQPDLIVSTGDLLDAQHDGCAGVTCELQSLLPRWGKFAITGNHEFYPGLTQSLKFIEEAGFTVLRGEARTVGDLVNVVGVDDKTGKYFGDYRHVPEPVLLTRVPQDKFTLLLKHQPVIDPGARDHFDLQLSGHTHKGQIFPFNLITRLAFPLNTGWHRVSERSAIYVSRGTGSWGPPMRFLAPPEISLIVLKPKPSGEKNSRTK